MALAAPAWRKAVRPSPETKTKRPRSTHLRVIERQKTGRACDSCGKWYQRGNRLRLWEIKIDGERTLYQRHETKLCTRCLKAKSVGSIIRQTTMTLSS